jgi:hypothetical protein
VLPNTFIAGAQKSGTTTLCSLLSCHPQVVVSEPKEPIFFSKAANLARPETYEACFRRRPNSEPRAVIDGSNAYMSDPAVAPRIREMLGKELRFIFCLRDPVWRMISGYWHQAKKGQDRRSLADALYVDSNSLDEAVKEEEDRLHRAAGLGLISVETYADRYDDPLWNFRYLRNSLYAADLQRFQETFGSTRIMVLLFEDVIIDPLLTMSKLSEFLKLDPAGFPDSLDLHCNQTRLPRLPGLLKTWRRLPAIGLLRRVPGYALASQALFYGRPASTPPEFTSRWRRLLAPEVARLQTMLDRHLIPLWSRE